jgi:hypothetical protein
VRRDPRLGHHQRVSEPALTDATPSLEFVVEPAQTTLVADTIRAAAGEAMERLTIAPVDGTPRYKIIVAVKRELMPVVMRAVMKALEKSG